MTGPHLECHCLLWLHLPIGCHLVSGLVPSIAPSGQALHPGLGGTPLSVGGTSGCLTPTPSCTRNCSLHFSFPCGGEGGCSLAGGGLGGSLSCESLPHLSQGPVSGPFPPVENSKKNR